MSNTIKARLVKLQGIMIFFLFFGVATLEAFQTRNWIEPRSGLQLVRCF